MFHVKQSSFLYLIVSRETIFNGLINYVSRETKMQNKCYKNTIL